MALTGIQIYKFLPKTNCKECGFPTCLAFAMKLSQRAVELSLCPQVSAESKAALEAASRPPIRLVTLGSDDKKKISVGNEVVLFRHDKTFYHPPGLVVRVKDTAPLGTVTRLVEEVTAYSVERVGLQLSLDGFAIQNSSQDVATFVKCVEAVAAQTKWPLVLMSDKPEAVAAALEKIANLKPLIYAATAENWDKMAELAKKCQCPLAVYDSQGLDKLSSLAEEIHKAGVEDLVLDLGARGFADSLTMFSQVRRLALKKNFAPLGYPLISFPGEAGDIGVECLLAAQHIAKYGGIIVIDHFSPEMVYPLLTLRLNIYTDPQKPIQVSPGVYPIGSPKSDSPLMVTTNFSLTYFSVVGEIEASRFPGWLLVCDTEGLSVLTSWAAGKFDAEKIAKTVKEFNVASNINHKSLIIPGKVAVLRGELEEELPGWQIMVGPPEAMEIGSYLKRMWVSPRA